MTPAAAPRSRGSHRDRHVPPCVSDCGVGLDELGEAPHWDAESGRLLWVDVRAGRVRWWDPLSGSRSSIAWPTPSVAIPADNRSLVIAGGDEVASVGSDGIRRIICRIEPELADTLLNDGKCDPRGRLWIGTYSLAGDAISALYRIDGDGRCERMRAGVRASNGLGWNAAGDRFYHVDTRARRLDEFDFDVATGTLGDCRPFAKFDGEDGLPDGLATDLEGGVWVAMFGGGKLHRYAEDGRLEQVVHVGVPHPTSVAFGGERRDVLYVTSSRHRLDPAGRDSYPLAGSLFSIDPGVRGVPAQRYRHSA